LEFGVLNFEDWNLFGIWWLSFGIYPKYPTVAHPTGA
jgi:hypothetical protein